MSEIYTIVMITDHSHIKKTDPYNRIGREMKIDPDYIKIGQSLFMECIDPGYDKSMITSKVVDYILEENGLLVIVTNNSIYYLQRRRDEVISTH